MVVFALFVAVMVFIGFLSLVGSPSETETMIGLIIATIVFLFALIGGWRSKSQSHEQDQNEKIAALEREVERLRSRKP